MVYYCRFFFYATVPILFTRIKNLNAAVLLTLVSFVFSMIFRLFLKKFVLIENVDLWNEFSYYNFITQLPVFGIGIIAYFLIIRKDFYINPLSSLSIFCLVAAHFIWDRIIPNFILFGCCFLLLVYTLSKKEFKFFVNSMTLFLGKISYSAYLVHFAVLHWLDKFKIIEFIVPTSLAQNFLIGYCLRLIFVILITSVLALMFYNCIEVPFQKMGKKIISIRDKNNYSSILSYNLKKN